MDLHDKKFIFVGVTLILFLFFMALGMYLFFERYEVHTIPDQNGCTMEAKICPDGSAVGRSGPNCEFTPCPLEIDDRDNRPCQDSCGDGACQEVVCLGTGCACAETSQSCPQDCSLLDHDSAHGGQGEQ
ncbi:MAG: hypothetical protein A3C84_05040 [Candidatus Ryanbacteria bacterium RIFCSPHIGHO2_02_FULL_48_12]|uniref:Uncharacterized protein n=1 Tax=Candidatus Ryanbacteria bacterium RIFCSPHIGHO2_01_FULL_48_27 TaxID=1802115 RepID=A0A1G2G7J9_9BACT|nr:MAG: hypothetical protein A2756_06085 [Candidatus Ryanbacteria bacterium RIFCSPHIGHO2_01_FULL_48_27]OGZ49528.1 MAG: hypothetical protein A3C84_05040 [Candidatus Ryanbacteria bacterium RIFCSPHIGHO2_02_FULL_48_12]